MNTRVRLLALGMLAVAAVPGKLHASRVDDLIVALGGQDEQARAEARQLLPREDVTAALPRLLPLLADERPAVWCAAFNVLADFANQACVPGREPERTAITARLMTLVVPEQPQDVKLRGLRLLPLVVPNGYDVSPIAALLTDRDLREKARAALQEMGTPQARAALRDQLAKADPEFQCALLNALGALRDEASLPAMTELTRSGEPAVRAAAVRALAWKGDPAQLRIANDVLGSADPATHADALDGLLRLVNAVVERGGNWQIAVNAYLDILKMPEPVAKEAALAGLGRVGDGSCVAPVLAAMRDAEPRTRGVALAALRSMQGVDVVRALVEAYPALPRQTQAALLPVLGGKHHALAAPILTSAVQSEDPAVRLAGLEALAGSGLPGSAETLIKAARTGTDQERGVARGGLLQLGDALLAGEQKAEAGKAYVAAFAAAPPDDQAARQRAAEGIAACPSAEAYETAKAIAADKNLGEVRPKVLVGVAGALSAAKQKDKALELYELAKAANPSAQLAQEIAKGMHAAGAKVDAQGLLGTVTKWWVVGPFELGEKEEGWKTEYVGEPNISLAAKYMSGKRRVAWTPVVSKDPSGKINLRKTVANSDKCIGYAYTEITVKKATDAVLLLGVDDSEKVWINGQKAFEQFVARALTVDQDRIPVKLQAGTNKILLKIWQNTMGWEFCLRITLPDGRALPFTQPE